MQNKQYWTTCFFVVAVFALLGCQRSEKTAASKKEAPATVANVVREESLNTIVLTEKAEERLGIKIGQATEGDFPAGDGTSIGKRLGSSA